MSDAKVLGHVIPEHRPAGSDTDFECGPGRTSFLPDFPCFAENQQKAARSSAGWNECPGEPTTLLDREMTRNTAMRSLKSISASMSGYTTDFYQGGRRSELVADKKIRVSVFSHGNPQGPPGVAAHLPRTVAPRAGLTGVLSHVRLPSALRLTHFL